MDNIKFRKPLFIEVEKQLFDDLYEFEAVYDEEKFSTKPYKKNSGKNYSEEPQTLYFLIFIIFLSEIPRNVIVGILGQTLNRTMEEFRASFYDSGYGRMWTQYSWYIRSSMNVILFTYFCIFLFIKMIYFNPKKISRKMITLSEFLQNKNQKNDHLSEFYPEFFYRQTCINILTKMKIRNNFSIKHEELDL
uniref:Uncharacterized protein n=1 Tax=Rhizophagus irregularis (strain DAOM 181602 / DAOM 197198 / MUCL 43194) TaxID=747089 RepID=U9UEK5_RHIID